MENIEAAIFDLDGTILDSMWFWGKIDDMFLTSRGISPIPEDYMLEIAHLGAYDTAVYTINRFGFSDTPEALIAEWQEMAIDFYTHEAKLKEYAEEYLLALKGKGIKLALATANDEELYLPLLKRTGLDKLFDAVVNVNEVERRKGFPDIYLLACERMGVSSEKSVVFEDIYLGITGAKAGGFRTVGVYDETSARDEKIIKETADRFIYSFKELLQPLAV